MIDRRLATEEELGVDEFFQPTDTSFLTGVVGGSSAPAAQTAATSAATSATARPGSFVVDPFSFGKYSIGEGEYGQSEFGNVQDYFNLNPLADQLASLRRDVSQGEGETTSAYNLKGVADFLNQQGMELREQTLPGNRVARWVQGPEGVVEGTYQEVELNNEAFGVASAALMAAAGNVMGPGMGLVNAVRAADQGDILGAIASAAPGVGQLTGATNLAKTVSQAAQVARAIEREDPLGLLASGSALANVKDIGGVPVKDVLNYGKVVQAIANEDPLAALMALGNTPAGKDVKLPTEITNPLSIASNLYRASQGDPRALLDAIKTVGYEVEARSVDEPPAPKTVAAADPIAEILAQAEALGDPYSLPMGTQVASVEAGAGLGGRSLFPSSLADQILAESAVEPISDEELLSYILPDYVFGRETPVDQRVEVTAPSTPIPSVLDVDEILRTPIPQEDLGTPAASVDQRVEVVAPRSDIEPIPSTLDVEDILRTPIPREDLGDLTQPVLDYVPADQRVEVVAPRTEPTPISSALDVDEILRTPIPQEDLGDLTQPVLDYVPVDQRVEIVAPRVEPTPIPSMLDVDEILRTLIPREDLGDLTQPVLDYLAETERRFDVKEGEAARVEIVAPRIEPTPIPSVLDVEDILRTPIPPEDLGDLTKPVLDYMDEDRTPVAPSPAPAPAPAPAASPAPAPTAPGPAPSSPALPDIPLSFEQLQDIIFRGKDFDVEQLLTRAYGRGPQRK
jgi:hypothetical protein